MLLKLTTICDVNHVISFTRPSSPLLFPKRGRPGDEAREFALTDSTRRSHPHDNGVFRTSIVQELQDLMKHDGD
jgi:hypothetical protein